MLHKGIPQIDEARGIDLLRYGQDVLFDRFDELLVLAARLYEAGCQLHVVFSLQVAGLRFKHEVGNLVPDFRDLLAAKVVSNESLGRLNRYVVLLTILEHGNDLLLSIFREHLALDADEVVDVLIGLLVDGVLRVRELPKPFTQDLLLVLFVDRRLLHQLQQVLLKLSGQLIVLDVLSQESEEQLFE